ncbi:MAG: NUDIX domain-containing protein [Paracoccaceae bacterium]
MTSRSPRLAVRAIILQDDPLLLVIAYPPSRASDLWCAPGGGVAAGRSLPDNLKREVHEETGLSIRVGALALVNEFHDPDNGFHQVELFFRCTIVGGAIDPAWRDPAHVVTKCRFFSRPELDVVRLKPDQLRDVAFGPVGPAQYDPLENIVR